MSLVAYTSSDGSSDEAEQQEKKSGSLKEKRKKFIEAPNLKNDDSDNEDYQPPQKKQSNIGLFSKLPAPKHSGKSAKITLSKITAPRQNALDRKKELLEKFKKKQVLEQNDDVDSDEVETESKRSFFSFAEESNKPVLPAASGLNINQSLGPKPIEFNASSSYTNMPYHEGDNSTEDNSAYERSAAPQFATQSDKELQRIQGKRFRDEKVDFIEIKADDALVGAQENLLKAISEESDIERKSHKKGTGPSHMQKKKHQLTYLIHQAQEREIELKNQWASNRHSKRQTAAKYGF